jgi:hypothetical protein
MKTYLCIEHGEKFTVDATNLEEARDKALIWGGEVMGEYNPVTNSIKI